MCKNNRRLYSKEADAFYKSYAWQKCRTTVLERDGYLCQVCIREDRPIPADTVHHIIHLKDDFSKALDENNLISVCRDCHRDLHPELWDKEGKGKRISKKIKVFEVEKNPEIF